MKRFILPFLCMLVFFLLPSCKKDEQGNITVNIEQTEYSLPEKGGVIDVSFVPLTAWEASCPDSFVSIDPSRGDASTEEVHVKITVEANDIPYEREIKVKVAFVFNTVDIAISQDAMTPPAPPTDLEGNLQTEDITIGQPIE